MKVCSSRHLTIGLGAARSDLARRGAGVQNDGLLLLPQVTCSAPGLTAAEAQAEASGPEPQTRVRVHPRTLQGPGVGVPAMYRPRAEGSCRGMRHAEHGWRLLLSTCGLTMGSGHHLRPQDCPGTLTMPRLPLSDALSCKHLHQYWAVTLAIWVLAAFWRASWRLPAPAGMHDSSRAEHSPQAWQQGQQRTTHHGIYSVKQGPSWAAGLPQQEEGAQHTSAGSRS